MDKDSELCKSLKERLRLFCQQHKLKETAAFADFLLVPGREAGKIEQFLHEFRTLPAEQQNDFELVSRLGRLLLANGQYQEAMSFLQQAGGVAPTTADKALAYHNQYLNFLELHNYDSAFDCYRQALSLAPERFTLFDTQRYVPLQILGAGSFGTVFLCQTAEHEEVVVKSLVCPTGNDHCKAIDLVLEQSARLINLPSPYIVAIKECGYVEPASDAEPRKSPHLVTEYFPAPTLEEWIQRHGRFSLDKGLRVAWAIAQGMRHAHEVEVLHRDLKPMNILYREGVPENVKIGDTTAAVTKTLGFALKIMNFALVMPRSVALEIVHKLNTTSQKTIIAEAVSGTWNYAAPEQKGEEPDNVAWTVDKYSDIFAYGRIMKTIFFGRLSPHPKEERSMPSTLMDLIGDCVADLPAHRPGSFAEISDRLEEISQALQMSLPVSGGAIFPERAPLERSGNEQDAPAQPANHHRRTTERTTRIEVKIKLEKNLIRLQGSGEISRFVWKTHGNWNEEQWHEWTRKLQHDGYYPIDEQLLKTAVEYEKSSYPQHRQHVDEQKQTIVSAEKGFLYQDALNLLADLRLEGFWDDDLAEWEARLQKKVETFRQSRAVGLQLWHELKDYAQAFVHLQTAHDLNPLDAEVQQAFQEVERELANWRQQQYQNAPWASELVETCGMPEKLLQHLIHRLGDKTLLDMSSDTWRELSYDDQNRYASAYQKAYAKHIGLEMEKSIDVLGVRFNLLLVPPGRFFMGSPENEPGRYSDEKQHCVTITRPFYLQHCEVTQAQWRTIIGDNPSYFKDIGQNAPVESVSWEDCQKFCKKVGMRMPTEAEWEYACRAGTTGMSYIGNFEISNSNSEPTLDKIAWYGSNKTHIVGQKKPNAFGLFDMLGNVWEWCQDWHEEYSAEEQIDPLGPASGTERVVRGGYRDQNCRCAYRRSNLPGHRGYYVGLRLAKNIA